MSGNYRDVDIDGYSENDLAGGGLALRYDDQSIKSTRSIVGVCVISSHQPRASACWCQTLRASGITEFEDDPRAVRAKYVLEDSLVAKRVESRRISRARSRASRMLTDQVDADFGVASIGLSAVFPRRLQAYLVYEALLGTLNRQRQLDLPPDLRGQF